MSKEKAPAKAKEEKAPAGKPADYLEVKERNKGIDMFSRGAGIALHLPHGTEDPYTAKAVYFDEPSRLGEGPCMCAKKFMMPNGDLIAVGQTFDPVVERMSVGKYRSLKDRKFFTTSDKSLENKLITASEKTK